MKIKKINFNDIDTIVIEQDTLLNVEVNNNELIISSDFNPTIVDSNFNELETRINKLENKLNILNATLKK